MSDLQFNNNGLSGDSYNDPYAAKGMAGWLIKKGIAKNKKSAETMMLIFAILGIIYSFFQITKQL
jgi:hypothetical protein